RAGWKPALPVRTGKRVLPNLSRTREKGGALPRAAKNKGHDSARPPVFNSAATVTPLFCSSLCRRSPTNRRAALFLDRGRAVVIARRTNRAFPDCSKDSLSSLPQPRRAFLLRFWECHCDQPISQFHHRSRRSRQTP